MDDLTFSLEDACDMFMEASGNKKQQYAVVSARTWGTFLGSLGYAAFGGISIPITLYNRYVGAYSFDNIEDAVFEWVDHNSIRKVEYDKKKKIMVVDKDWYEKEKKTEVVFLKCPDSATAKATFGGDTVIPTPYIQHGGIFKTDPFSWDKPYALSFAKQTGIYSELTTFEKVCKKAKIKIKTVDASIAAHGLKQVAKKIFIGAEATDDLTALESALLKNSYKY